jgi:hypothetical protein
MMGDLGIGNAEVRVRQRSSRCQQIKTIVWCLSHYSDVAEIDGEIYEIG